MKPTIAQLESDLQRERERNRQLEAELARLHRQFGLDQWRLVPPEGLGNVPVYHQGRVALYI